MLCQSEPIQSFGLCVASAASVDQASPKSCGSSENTYSHSALLRLTSLFRDALDLPYASKVDDTLDLEPSLNVPKLWRDLLEKEDDPLEDDDVVRAIELLFLCRSKNFEPSIEEEQSEIRPDVVTPPIWDPSVDLLDDAEGLLVGSLDGIGRGARDEGPARAQELVFLNKRISKGTQSARFQVQAVVSRCCSIGICHCSIRSLYGQQVSEARGRPCTYRVVRHLVCGCERDGAGRDASVKYAKESSLCVALLPVLRSK